MNNIFFILPYLVRCKCVTISTKTLNLSSELTDLSKISLPLPSNFTYEPRIAEFYF